MTEIPFRTLSPFGVEIDMDLSRPLSPGEREGLARLRCEHHLVLARGQALDMAQQIAVMSSFGPVLHSRDDGIGYISNVRPDGTLGDSELEFHSDQDYSPMGAYYAIGLHAIELSGPSTPTTFCSAARAFDTLPSDLRARLFALEALDVQLRDVSRRNRAREVAADTLRCVHPVVRHLPLTGRPALFVSRSGTDKIMGLEAEESDALLDLLFSHLYAQDNLYVHNWRVGDIVMWDNRALQHRRDPVPAGARRTLQRTSCAEPEAGIFNAYPQHMKRSAYATAEAV